MRFPPHRSSRPDRRNGDWLHIRPQIMRSRQSSICSHGLRLRGLVFLLTFPSSLVWRHLAGSLVIVEAQWRTSMAATTRARGTCAAVTPTNEVTEYVILPGTRSLATTTRQSGLYFPVPQAHNGGGDGVAFGDERWIMYLQRSFSSARLSHRMGSRTSIPSGSPERRSRS